MKHKMNAYCFFCETKKAGMIADMLEKRGVHRAFSPKIIKRQRIKGENHDIWYDLLPGYVFAYDEEILKFPEILQGISGVIRRLGGAEEQFLLKNGDLDFAMRLYERNGMIEQITVFKEGDQVRIEDILFRGCRGTIMKMDYKKQRARVEFEFAGTRCTTWIACELMNKKK